MPSSKISLNIDIDAPDITIPTGNEHFFNIDFGNITIRNKIQKEEKKIMDYMNVTVDDVKITR